MTDQESDYLSSEEYRDELTEVGEKVMKMFEGKPAHLALDVLFGSLQRVARAAPPEARDRVVAIIRAGVEHVCDSVSSGPIMQPEEVLEALEEAIKQRQQKEETHDGKH